jgi:hypothetical protein
MTEETTSAPAADAFAGQVGGAPAAPAQAPATPVAPAPSAPPPPVERNPFAGKDVNLTEIGQLVRDAPERARELIVAAGREKEFATTLQRISDDATKAVAVSIPAEPVPGVHPAVRLAELDHISEVTYRAKGLEAEHAKLVEAAEKMTPEQVAKPLPVDTTFETLKFGGGDQFIRDMTPEQKSTAHRGAVAFVQSLGSVQEQHAFINAASSLPTAVRAAFMAEMASPPRGDGKPFYARMSERLSKGKDGQRAKEAGLKFYDWLPQEWKSKLEQL